MKALSIHTGSVLLALVTLASTDSRADATPGPARAEAQGHAMTTSDAADNLPKPDAGGPLRLFVPPELAETDLDSRAREQRAAVAKSEVFSFFRFTDRIAQSGITFRNQVVDDAGRDYKMVHYDHGGGIAAADIDGDGLLDIYFTSQVGSNELWRNLGGGKFENVTDKAGVAMVDRITVGATFADFDNDGDPDLFVTTVRKGNALFRNDGKGNFEDVSAAAGVGYVGHSSGAIAFDYNRDGLVDLFVTNVGRYTTDKMGRAGYYIGIDEAFSGHMRPELTETSILYKNLGGMKFADVSKETGLVDPGWSGDASAADLDGDGWPDLYVLNMQGDDHYWRNVEGKRFEQKTAEVFPKTPWGAMGIKFFDVDGNGHLDLLLSDMHSDMSENIGPEREKLKSRIQWDHVLAEGENNIFGNALWRNNGGTFTEVSDAMGAENYWPWGISADDVNADGFDDVLLTSSMNYPFRYLPNTLLLNDGGRKLVDAEFAVGVEPRAGGATSTPWFELDCSAADRGHDHCKGLEGRVVVYGALGTRSAVMFDVDGDGDLDIVTLEFNSPPQVLISDLAAQTKVRSLEIELQGVSSNRDGLGAIVSVVAGERPITKLHDGKSGYLAQSSLPLYFGLGDAQKVDRVEVRWPSGIAQVITEGITVGKRLVVVEPKE